MANNCRVFFKITGNKNDVNELKEKLDFVIEKHKEEGCVSFAFLYEEYGFEYEKATKYMTANSMNLVKLKLVDHIQRLI